VCLAARGVAQTKKKKNQTHNTTKHKKDIKGKGGRKKLTNKLNKPTFLGGGGFMFLLGKGCREWVQKKDKAFRPTNGMKKGKKCNPQGKRGKMHGKRQ